MNPTKTTTRIHSTWLRTGRELSRTHFSANADPVSIDVELPGISLENISSEGKLIMGDFGRSREGSWSKDLALSAFTGGQPRLTIIFK